MTLSLTIDGLRNILGGDATSTVVHCNAAATAHGRRAIKVDDQSQLQGLDCGLDLYYYSTLDSRKDRKEIKLKTSSRKEIARSLRKDPCLNRDQHPDLLMGIRAISTPCLDR